MPGAQTQGGESHLSEGLDTELAAAPGESSFLPPPRRQRLPVARSTPNTAVAHWGVAILAVIAWSAVLLAGLGAMSLPADAHTPVLAALLVLAVATLAALLVPRPRAALALNGVLLLSVLIITLLAVVLGLGAGAPGLGLIGIFTAVACFAAGLRAGVLLATIGAACVLLLQFGAGWLPSAVPTGPAGSQLQWLAHLLEITAGLLCGWAFSRAVSRHLHDVDEREHRFSGLLAVAADAYWELDTQYRVLTLAEPRKNFSPTGLAAARGKPPWEIPAFGCEPDVLDTLQADLETRVAFRDLPMRWHSRSRGMLHFSVSGEPRFDERNVFRGYWGVARDVTAHVMARQALAATETRYQELFTRIPNPLVLHRAGLVIDANPAALQLFGYTDLAAMLGHDVLENHESGDSRERARRRLEQLESLPPGEALPVADFRLRNRSGRRMATRATGVRVEAEGGPATLSIFVDDTERRRAEEAVRRSEALLSHLVATSPDVITLTDLATGRYAMVNHTFETITGYSATEVVGKTSLEMGIWRDTQQREGFVALVRERGIAREVPCDFVTKTGQTVQLLVSGAVFAMDRRTYLVINGRDITAQERSRLERDAILANASIGIAVTRDQHFVLTNPRFDQMFGWAEGELLGQSGAVVWLDESDYAEVGRQLGPALARGELVEIERPGRRRDGSSFIARILGKAIDPTRTARSGTIWIVEDVTERRQVGQALARARDEAEAANRAKSAFLANTSHELRTPLNGMLGLAQLAREPDIDPQRRQLYLDQIVDNAHALAAIISDVLDLSKIEAGKLTLEATCFDLAELLRGLKQAYGALASGRGLELQVHIDDGLLGHVQGDPLRVRQVLSNFLSNAMKFTESGAVRLDARRLDADRVRFEVIDSGPGIDAATQARLFRPFTQADESITRRFGGTGLGLSICRELAALMGGTVGVTSEAGAGACFWAELPLPATDEPQPAVLRPAPRDLAGLKVLMVEDNAVNMMIGVAILERWGAQVMQANDGHQAVQAVQRATAEGRPFDVVLMDVQMPVMSGYEATRALRQLEGGRHLPIIALTAAALVSEREQALDAGMDDFLTKPIDADKLRHALGRWSPQAPQDPKAPPAPPAPQTPAETA